MNIVFFVSCILLIISFLLIKRNDKKSNLLKWILLSIVIFFCYNSFVVFLLSLFNIVAFEWVRLIINVLLIGCFSFMIYRKKEIQQYYIKVTDVIISILLVVSVLLISNWHFKNNNFYFETTDPSVHFSWAERFFEKPTLGMDMDEHLFYSSNSFDLFSAYVSAGTVFEFFGSKNVIDHLNLFVVFEVGVLILSCLMLYFSIVKDKSKWYIRVLSGILSLVYILGYPLNNLIFGFHYLGLSILLINAIIVLFMDYFKNDRSSKLIYYILLALLNFSVFSFYYLFVPIIFGAEGLYLLLRWIFKKNTFKEFAFMVLYTLIIPFIIGIAIYFIYPRFLPNSSGGLSPFLMDGYIYRNLIGDFIIFIPFVIYSIINSIKDKKINVLHCTYPFIILFMLGVFFWILFGDAATYYYYKFYFLLSMIVFMTIGIELNKKNNLIFIIFVIYLAVLLSAQLFNIEDRISKKEFLLNPVSSINSVEYVYYYNRIIIDNREPVFTKSQLESLDKIDGMFGDEVKSGNIIFYSGLLQKLWFYSIYDISATYNYSTLGDFYEENVSFDKIKDDGKYKYILLNSNDEMKNEINKKFNTLYEDNNFIFFVRNN